MRGSTYEAVQLLSRMMHVDGHIYPSSETPLTLHAVFKDGTTAIGESKIALDRKTIDRVFVRNTEDESEAKSRPQSRFCDHGSRYGRLRAGKLVHEYSS